LVFINGDIAWQAGLTPDYAAVLGLLQPLREEGLPIYLGVGNHDSREHFWHAMRRSKSVQSALPSRQIAIVPTPQGNWFVLDSLVKTQFTPGRLGDAQLTWLAAALDAHSDKPALVMIHHNPDEPGLPFNAIGVQDTAALMAILRPRRHVKAYFYGHTHSWEFRQDESGLHLVNLPPTAYLFVKGRPNGWVHATVNDNGARLELRCLDKTRPDLGQTVDLAWRSA
jgi:3',5'-cyclic AMP phosphodiesterase CpdA